MGVSRSGGMERRVCCVCHCAKARRTGVLETTPAVIIAAEVEVRNWRIFMLIFQGLAGSDAIANHFCG
jgi:hypothetical protein